MSTFDRTHHNDKGDAASHGNQPASRPQPTQSPEMTQKRTARVPRPSKGTAAIVSPTPPPPSISVPLPPSHIPVSLMEEGLSVGQANGARNHDDWLMTASSASSPIVICDDGTGEEGIIMVTEDPNNASFSHLSRNKPPSAGNSKQQRVQCPVCGASFTEAQINMHLDRCLQTSGASTSTSGDTQSLQKPKKLPKIDMIQRLQEFSLRYNAQCDSQNPRTVEQVAGDMVKDDLTRQSVSVPPVDNMHVPKGCTDEEMDQLRRKYEARHKDHFTQLAQELRQRSEPVLSSPPLSPSTLTPPISTAPVAMVTQASSSESDPAPTCVDGEKAESTTIEATDYHTVVPESPGAWQARLHSKMSRKRKRKRNRPHISCGATSSDNDNDSSDSDFVETRTTAKRWKQ
eukprot:Em0001g411a